MITYMPTISDKSSKKNTLTRRARETLQEQIVRILSDEITRGTLSPGDKLPSVRELAARYSVSRETAKLAIGTLREMGYVEVFPGRGAFVRIDRRDPEKRPRTGTLGFIMGLGSSPSTTSDFHIVYDSLLRAMDHEAEGYGYHLLTSYVSYSLPEGAARLAGLLEKVDALFVAGLMNEELYRRLRELSIPVVSILSNIEGEALDSVGIDGYRSFYHAAERLLELGHKKLIYIDGPEDYYQKERRKTGIGEAVETARRKGVGAEVSCISAEGWTAEEARTAGRRLLEQNPPPDAIIAVNDLHATGMMQACTERGLAIPKDLSVIGAKNTLFSSSSSPPLSSLDYHFEEIAALSMSRIEYRLKQSDRIPARIEVLAELIERESIEQKRQL